MCTAVNSTAYIEELEAMDCIWLTPKQAAPGYGVTPYYFNVAVDEDMRRYGEIVRFPFLVMRNGRRVKIHRVSYINWLRNGINRFVYSLDCRISRLRRSGLRRSGCGSRFLLRYGLLRCGCRSRFLWSCRL